jgi:hypothetical protein
LHQKIASLWQIGEREERCSVALFCSLGSCSRSNICLGLLGVELENLVNTKVVEYFNTFLFCIYVLSSIEYSGSYDFCKFAVSNYQFQISVNTFSFGKQFNIA